MYNNLVLSGGAFKCSAFIGCLKFLEENNHVSNIKNVIGSSAGSIIACLYCLGFTADAMRDIFIKSFALYTNRELDSDVENMFDFIDKMGIEDAEVISKMLSDILLNKYNVSEISFIELAKKTGKNLIITGSNLSLVKTDYFSVNTHPDMSIYQAIRISISIPYIFKPVIFNEMLYTDASLFNNFPLDFFDSKIPYQNTISILLETKNTIDIKKLNIFNYTRVLFDAVFYKLNGEYKTGIEKNNIIIKINFEDNSFDFGAKINENMLDKYIEQGYTYIVKHSHLFTE